MSGCTRTRKLAKNYRPSAHCAWSDHFVVGIPVSAMEWLRSLPLVGVKIFC
jgi:hypothetical protein